MNFSPALKAGSFQSYSLPHKRGSHHLQGCSVVTVCAEISQPGVSPWAQDYAELSAQGADSVSITSFGSIAVLDWKGLGKMQPLLFSVIQYKPEGLL